MSEELENLKPWFDSINEDDEDKLNELNQLFKSQFIDNSVYFQGKKVVVKGYSCNPEKDNLPAHFANYYEKFVHIITRKSDDKRGNKKRIFRAERANRIHWIKPILENHDDPLISTFSFLEYNGRMRDYFWYKEKNYMVVIEEITKDYMLITGFCIDKSNKNYYARKESKGL